MAALAAFARRRQRLSSSSRRWTELLRLASHCSTRARGRTRSLEWCLLLPLHGRSSHLSTATRHGALPQHAPATELWFLPADPLIFGLFLPPLHAALRLFPGFLSPGAYLQLGCSLHNSELGVQSLFCGLLHAGCRWPARELEVSRNQRRVLFVCHFSWRGQRGRRLHFRACNFSRDWLRRLHKGHRLQSHPRWYLGDRRSHHLRRHWRSGCCWRGGLCAIR